MRLATRGADRDGAEPPTRSPTLAGGPGLLKIPLDTARFRGVAGVAIFGAAAVAIGPCTGIAGRPKSGVFGTRRDKRSRKGEGVGRDAQVSFFGGMHKVGSGLKSRTSRPPVRARRP